LTHKPPPSTDKSLVLFNAVSLKSVLFDEYGGFADRRIRNFQKGHIFIVDDRASRDIGANRELYSYFCPIYADVITDDMVEVRLSGNVPGGPSVTNWIARHNPSSRSPFLEFRVARGKQKMLGDLASGMRAIVRRGAPRYDVASYKHVCPRTAASLDRLERVLDRAWKTGPVGS
jgi:hypothetical protein